LYHTAQLSAAETDPPISERIFRALSDEVLSGRYAPGEKLPTQRRLAAELGVNMAPVREALKRLEQLRLVEARQGDAIRVADWRARGGLDVIAHVLVRSGALDREALDAVMEARASMLSEAGRLAAERRGDDHAARLREIAAAICDAAGAEAAQALDFAFFAELVDASGNVVFVLVMNSIRELYFEHAGLFRAIVDADRSLPELYAAAAAAVSEGDDIGAAGAVRELCEAQATRLGIAIDFAGSAGKTSA
jgi:GntR family transcriptional regulator, transcriptional repressor for pyruvate dehydrogenase complex